MSDKQRNEAGTRRRVATLLTAVAAVGSVAGWLLATVLEYLQWPTAAKWTLHGAVVLVALTGLAALAAYVWRDEAPADGRDDPD